MNFEEIWKKIVENKNKEFHTKTGLPFTYEIKGNNVIPNRTNYMVHKSNFKKAYKLIPIYSPGEIRDEIRGPTYVWAILNDERIKRC